ncbi:hypothetical protein ACHAXA_011861 [Cyclostephanos tholiformis]|uniref:Telomerase activating protein Est1 n=1 Tax=Cyclostephanos tholiformis TaxID=382380 RepID=A0ABD3RU50_9STRA
MGRSNKQRRGGGGGGDNNSNVNDPHPPPSQDTNACSGEGGGSGPSQLSSSSLSQESSSSESVLSKLARAFDIEKTFEAMRAEGGNNGSGVGVGRKSTTSDPAAEGVVAPPRSSSLDEKNLQSLRLQLCSILSDVMLVDPIVAEKHDAPGRLWKGCFYGRINELRSRISKEKIRAKRRHHGQSGGGGGGGGGDPIAGGASDLPGGKIVADLEGQLSKFLDEAIQLYKYIIERYVVELTPPSSQSQSVDEEGERDRARVIVSSLHRMHIHLGDLHRYSSSHGLAEACYLRASRLSPGSGNAYNQLAVVAQTQIQTMGMSCPAGKSDDMVVVALYYYARSLMSTEEPFDTSRSNLTRLYEANRRWLGEHSRVDDDDRDFDNRHAHSAVDDGTTMSRREQKEQREWMQRERAVANRRWLARFVDLQWDFARGIIFSSFTLSGDADVDDDGRVDMEGLVGRASSLFEAFAHHLRHVSFSESLLCKLISILAYSTLSAGNGSRLTKAATLSDGGGGLTKDKRPRRDYIAVAPDQALAFSFCLRFCALLAEDVDSIIAKRGTTMTAVAAGSSTTSSSLGRKVGSIRALSPLLLGLCFVTSIYDGCEWFHAASFFLDGVGAKTRDGSDNNSAIREFCKESHAMFWTSFAKLASRLDALMKNNIGISAGRRGGETDLAAISGFEDYRGFVPFSSFLDNGRDDAADILPARNGKRAVTYVTADEAIRALAVTKNPHGDGKGRAGDALTRAKIDVILSIADWRTASNVSEYKNGRCFMKRNAETNGREFVHGGLASEEQISHPQSHSPGRMYPTMKSPPPSSPDFTNMNVEVDASITRTENATSTTMAAAPLKNPYSDIKVALLTPAALLAGSEHHPHANNLQNDELKMMPTAPIGSIVSREVNAKISPISSTIPTKSVDSLIDIFNMTSQSAPLKMSIPPPPGLSPPPGFSVHPQRVYPQAPFPSGNGISLAEFPAPLPSEQTAGKNFPQAGLSHPSSNIFGTMNPFAQQAPPPLFFNNDYFAVSNTSKTNHHIGVPFQQPATNGELDPTVGFLLGSNRMQHFPDDLASSDTFDLLLPSAVSEAEDQSESILNFLFNSNDTSRSRQPLYAAGQRHPLQSQRNGPPQTMNPFAT